MSEAVPAEPRKGPISDLTDQDLEAAEPGLAKELRWLRDTYQGDHVKQATARAILMGGILGGALSLQNLFVGLKTGWGLGVAITACILSYTIYASLVRVAPRVFGQPMSILENNCMQSTASSAGYSTGGVMTSAIAAYLIVNGRHVGWVGLTLWTFFLAILGTVMAIPMKRQMINIEQLKFPSGIAAAETLKSLHAEGDEASQKARALGYSGLLGALVAWFRDAHAPEAFQKALEEYDRSGHWALEGKSRATAWIMVKLTALSKIPGMLEFPRKLPRSLADLKAWLTNAVVPNGTYPTVLIAGVPAVKWTVAFEGSLIMIAAGGLMGMRPTISMMVGAFVNWVLLAPKIKALGGITALGYRGIVSWSLWPGASIMVMSGLLTFGLQWRTVLRAFKGLGSLFSPRRRATHETEGHETEGKGARTPLEAAEAHLDTVEVPSSWFVSGIAFSTLGIVIVGKIWFGIGIGLSIIAVALTFVLSIVACRATGETDTTPIGAMGKITQLTYGVLAPGNITTNLMTASITAGAAGSSADLLTDLKSGYLLGANPRKQFLAQLAGCFVGTAVVVPMFYKLVPTAATLGSDKFPAPAAQVWSGVAKLLSQGVHQLHPTARWAILVGCVIGLILPLLELWFPRHKAWIPSATGLGLSMVIPFFNSYSMFLGALMAWMWAKWRPEPAERYTVALSSGLIAGESLMGVVVMLLGGVLGLLE